MADVTISVAAVGIREQYYEEGITYFTTTTTSAVAISVVAK